MVAFYTPTLTEETNGGKKKRKWRRRVVSTLLLQPNLKKCAQNVASGQSRVVSPAVPQGACENRPQGQSRRACVHALVHTRASIMYAYVRLIVQEHRDEDPAAGPRRPLSWPSNPSSSSDCLCGGVFACACAGARLREGGNKVVMAGSWWDVAYMRGNESEVMDTLGLIQSIEAYLSKWNWVTRLTTSIFKFTENSYTWWNSQISVLLPPTQVGFKTCRTEDHVCALPATCARREEILQLEHFLYFY